MFARVVTIEGKPEKVDEGIRYFWEQLIPTARSLHGFKDGYIMVDRKTGKLVSIVMWESLKDIQATSATADKKLSERVKIAGATKQPKYEIFEVMGADIPSNVAINI
jgi:hypothetical protein